MLLLASSSTADEVKITLPCEEAAVAPAMYVALPNCPSRLVLI